MAQIIFELTDLEAQVLAHIAADPDDWLQNLVDWQVRLAKDEIVDAEIAKMVADPNCPSIPSDRDAIVLQADLTPAAERQ